MQIHIVRRFCKLLHNDLFKKMGIEYPAGFAVIKLVSDTAYHNESHQIHPDTLAYFPVLFAYVRSIYFTFFQKFDSFGNAEMMPVGFVG